MLQIKIGMITTKRSTQESSTSGSGDGVNGKMLSLTIVFQLKTTNSFLYIPIKRMSSGVLFWKKPSPSTYDS